jgi:hypothetical protein
MPEGNADLRRPILSDAHPVLLAGGVATGTAAGLYVGDLTQSWWAGGLTFVASLYLAARAVPDIATEGNPARRLVYFLTFPATAALMTFLLWTLLPDWFAVPVAAVCGWILQSAIGRYIYPDVGRQEEAHTWDRA